MPLPGTTNKNFIEPALNESNPSWGSTLNSLFNAIDAVFGSTTIVSGLTTGTTTLSNIQYPSPFLKLSGTLTGNVIISLPAGVAGLWYIYNGCTNTGSNTFTVTFASNGVNGQILSAANWNAVACDGSGVFFQNTVAPSAAGSNTQVQYNNNGALGASSGLTYGAQTSTFTGSIAAGTSQLVLTSPTGTLYTGMTLGTITGGTFTTPTAVVITGQVSGTTGGAGTYSLSQTNTAGTGATVASATFTALSASNIIGTLLGSAQSATYAGATTIPVGYVSVPQTTSTTVGSATDGYHVYTSGSVTVTGSSFSIGDCFVIVNSGSSVISIIPGASTTLRLAASTATPAQNYTVSFTNGSANITGSGLPVVGSAVQFTTTGTLPTGFTVGTTYYVLTNTSGTTVTVSATPGGTAITATSAGSGTHTMANYRTIAGYGQAVVLCTASNQFYISGQGAN